MKKAFFRWIAVILSLFGGVAFADDPAATSPPAATSFTFRVSALVQRGGGVQVGFVDEHGRNPFFIPERGSSRGIRVLAVDYAGERVTLESGGSTFILQLTEDPSSREVRVPAVWRGTSAVREEEPTAEELGIDRPYQPRVGPSEGIRAMMAQFPDAIPTNWESQPNAIKTYLEAHPEAAPDPAVPPGRFGPGIEAMLKEHPELTNKLVRPSISPL